MQVSFEYLTSTDGKIRRLALITVHSQEYQTISAYKITIKILSESLDKCF